MACIWFWKFYSIKLLRSICYQSCSSWDQLFWKGALSPRLLETFGCKSTNSYQKQIYSASIWTNNMKMIAPRISISRKYMLQIWTKNAQLHGTMYFSLPCLSHGLTAEDVVGASRPRMFNEAGKGDWRSELLRVAQCKPRTLSTDPQERSCLIFYCEHGDSWGQGSS